MVKVVRFLINKKVQASTMIEMIVAMTVIILVIGLGLMILSNVMRLSLSGKQIKANALLQEELIKTTNSGQVTNESLIKNGWRIDKTFKPNIYGESLLEADFIIYDQNNIKIAHLESIIVHEIR
ncbi:hypothetical protein [Mucilaginibacter jinjuensis]|uniref:Prepilin-type N-terminal cleavage/methylation domain-containing protein n=1 Tax=Mucilaginibacter jinjuensis TaxID=1176721 RepID=A0ABY7TAX2_9SPHI|nr:hypothetical protein [Mucilaginibacter jinjuensis]WCT13655.1 hypothetical protein PQO05_06865 [Mucilaginibacter jinjuensis]